MIARTGLGCISMRFRKFEVSLRDRQLSEPVSRTLPHKERKRMKPTTKMRELIHRDTTTIMPAVGDPFAARLVKAEGYETVMVSGNATSAMRLGLPDMSLLTLTENAETVRRVYDATGLAVFADADTGFGNAISLRRTVRELERAGAAAIMFEDQIFPKRCGMLAGKALVTTEEMIDKVHAAVDARQDPDLVIVARTDAIDVDGFEAAVERAQRYAEAGADAIYVGGPRSETEVERLAQEIDKPQLYNITPTGSVPRLNRQVLSALGFKILTFSVYLVLMAIPSMRKMLRELAETGDIDTATQGAASLEEYHTLLDLDGWSEPAGLTQLQEAAP